MANIVRRGCPCKDELLLIKFSNTMCLEIFLNNEQYLSKQIQKQSKLRGAYVMVYYSCNSIFNVDLQISRFGH